MPISSLLNEHRQLLGFVFFDIPIVMGTNLLSHYLILVFFPSISSSKLDSSRAECFDGQPVVARVCLLGCQLGLLGDTSPAPTCGLVPRVGVEGPGDH